MAPDGPFDQERVTTESDYVETDPRVQRPVDPNPAYVRVDPVDEVHSVREDVIVDHVTARRSMLSRIENILWFFCGLIAIMLALRIAFLLLNANTSSGFVSFVNGFTNPFVRPFEGIFTNPSSGDSVLDLAAVLSMIVVAIVTWVIVRLLWLVLDIPESGTRRSVRDYRHDRT